MNLKKRGNEIEANKLFVLYIDNINLKRIDNWLYEQPKAPKVQQFLTFLYILILSVRILLFWIPQQQRFHQPMFFTIFKCFHLIAVTITRFPFQ